MWYIIHIAGGFVVLRAFAYTILCEHTEVLLVQWVVKLFFSSISEIEFFEEYCCRKYIHEQLLVKN